MSEILQGLAAVPGVFGCAVFAKSGQCLAYELSPPYEPVLFTQLLGLVDTTFQIFNSVENNGPATQLAVRCESGVFVLRAVGDHLVMVINQVSTNSAMLSVALNVVAAKLGLPQASPAYGSGSASAMSGGATSGMSGMSWASSSAGTVPLDAVERSTVKALLKALQSFLGPAAKAVLKQEMVALGMRPSTLTKSQGADLSVALSRRIGNDEWRQNFLSAAEQLFK